MEVPTARKVSLRGASVKEYSRSALLEKVADERAQRALAKKRILAAVTIQRIWRGRKVAKAAAEQMALKWDQYVMSLQNLKATLEAEKIMDDVLRPFVFFTRRLNYRTCLLEVEDVRRVSVCFQILLQSMSYQDNKNFCFLASTGVSEVETCWFYQVHRLFAVASAALAGMFRNKNVSLPLVGLAVRLLVSITDGNMWNEAGHHLARLLRMLVQGGCGFYPAAHGYLLAVYTSKDASSKDSFLLTASLTTIALRPLHHAKAVDDIDVAKKAAEQVCRYILTVPQLLARLPSVLVPAYRHVDVLGACLRSLKDGQGFEAALSHEAVYEDIPLAGWALANVISLASTDKSVFSNSIVHEDYVDAVYSLLQSLMSWVDAVREWRKDQEEKGETSCCVHDLHNESLLRDFVCLLKPLHQQWHLVQLLPKTLQEPGISKASQVDHVPLTKTARLYCCLLTAFSALNSQGGALPVLNMLAFTKQLLPQLWNWLRHCLSIDCETSSSQRLIPARRDDSLARSMTSSKWVNNLLKVKSKSASVDTASESQVSNHQTSGRSWHIEQMKGGPSQIPEEAIPVLTLFCTIYAHLLLVLDDEEFYNKQVPFSLEEQRLLSAMLNTMVYHGLLLAARQRFPSLMDASCRCLRALFERDSRRNFCPRELWLAPAVELQPAIAAAARAHEVASVSKAGETSQAPGLGAVLTSIPHVLPFEERVQIFREFVRADKVSRKIGGEAVGPGPGSIEVSIRRDRIVEDGLAQVNSLGPRLKNCINVSFVNDYGLPEAGLDYGGLFKEFLTNLANAAFDPGYGLFLQTVTEERFLFPHPGAISLAHGLKTMEFLGRIVGKALYEGILLEQSFSPVFIAKLLGRYTSIDDLASLDPELHRNLVYLKNYEGDVADLCLDFTVTEELFGKLNAVELIPGGAEIPVTNANKLQYVYAMADYKLSRQVRPVVNAFLSGLTDLIDRTWLSLFNAHEFNQLLSGEEQDFDVQDLKMNTRYTGGYTASSRTVKLFWEVLEGLDTRDKRALLKFVTSCSRPPLLGFKHLQPSFTIHKVTCDTPLWMLIAGQDVDRLPSASTCYNILKLPTYRRSSTLREKLQYAIRSNAGFELS